MYLPFHITKQTRLLGNNYTWTLAPSFRRLEILLTVDYRVYFLNFLLFRIFNNKYMQHQETLRFLCTHLPDFVVVLSLTALEQVFQSKLNRLQERRRKTRYKKESINIQTTPTTLTISTVGLTPSVSISGQCKTFGTDSNQDHRLPRPPPQVLLKYSFYMISYLD